MRLPAVARSLRYRAIVLYFALSFGLCFLAYATGQHILRTGANDPQIQLAEDGAIAMAAGVAPADIAGSSAVDVTSSLSPIVITYHPDGSLSAFNGSFGSATPVPPSGAFAYARLHGQDRFTWEPSPGLRLATVLAYNGEGHPGYVLAARNLREVEAREAAIMDYAGAALAVLLLLGLALLVIIK